MEQSTVSELVFFQVLHTDSQPLKWGFFIMQQKVFNLFGTLGFVMSATMVVGSLLLYTRIPSLTKYYMSELKLELTKMVTDVVPGQIDDVMPELPSATGPAIETPKLPF